MPSIINEIGLEDESDTIRTSSVTAMQLPNNKNTIVAPDSTFVRGATIIQSTKNIYNDTHIYVLCWFMLLN